MKKLLLTAAAMVALHFGANAQISALPYTQNFTEAFGPTGENVQIYPNYTANESQAGSRIFRDETDYSSAPAALSVIPTGSFDGQVTVDFNFANYSNVSIAFAAKSMQNGTGNRPSSITLSTSVDGGSTWVGSQLIASLPNENQTAFTTYNYTFPAAANNQSSVKLRFVVATGTGGSGTRAKVVIDDLAVAVSSVVNPALSANVTSLSFTQTVGAPSAPQVVALTGSNLTSDVTVNASTPFQISLSPTSGYGTSLTVPQTNGAINGTLVYVRSNGATAGVFTSFLPLMTSGLATQNIPLSSTIVASTATNPAPFDLSTGNYTFGEWAAESARETYPANMVFWTHAITDPTLDIAFNENYTCLYSLGARSRFSGKGDMGVSMINTGNSQYVGVCDGSNPAQNSGDEVVNGRAGAIVLGLNTTGRQNLTVNWTGRTILKNFRVYALTLQYRIGAGSPNSGWTNIPTSDDAITQYQSGEDNTSQNFSTTLPAELNDKAEVQLRWVYNYIETGASGARAELALDDVTVVSEVLGLDDFSSNGFAMYPNPANSVVNFTQPLVVTVYDFTGKTVFSSDKEITTLDVSDFATGIYLVKTTKGAVKKLIIK